MLVEEIAPAVTKLGSVHFDDLEIKLSGAAFDARTKRNTKAYAVLRSVETRIKSSLQNAP